jgi:hypothetical protein
MADPYNPPPGSVCAGNTDLFGPVFIPATAVGAPANTQVVLQAIYVRQVSGGGSYQPGDVASFPAGEAAALRAIGAAV